MLPDLKGLGVILWAGFIAIILATIGSVGALAFGIYALARAIF